MSVTASRLVTDSHGVERHGTSGFPIPDVTDRDAYRDAVSRFENQPVRAVEPSDIPPDVLAFRDLLRTSFPNAGITRLSITLDTGVVIGGTHRGGGVFGGR